MSASTSQIPGFTYSSEARAGMPQLAISDFDRELLAIGARRGLVGWFDPLAGDANGVIVDKINGSRWTLQGDGARPGYIDFNLLNVLQFTHNVTSSYKSGFDLPSGSFSIAMVYGHTAGEAASTVNRVLIASGDEIADCMNMRWSPAGSNNLVWHAQNGSANLTLSRPAGGHINIFSYDAESGVASVYAESGAPVSSVWADAPTVGPIHLGGFDGQDGYGLSGRIGHVLVFDVALARAENAVLRERVMTAIIDHYAP